MDDIDDIAIRLRSHETEGVTGSDRYHLRNEAAEEIDRLREALRGVVAALSQPGTFHADIAAAKAFALRALSPTASSQSSDRSDA